jgi:solute carrier family 45 protein 1/2/4
MFVTDESLAKTCTITLAVFSIYAVDFAINAVQSCSRSLIVDTLPIPKQQLGSAWASRMVAVGHLVGYAMGTVDLVGVFGATFGDTQFKQLALIAAFALLFTTGITCWAVTERVLISTHHKNPHSKSGGFKIMRQIIKTTMHLPPRIQAICWAQFWSWIGWFPFLFYSSTWVGETYFRYDAPHDVKESKDALGDIGRIGSMALVVFSMVTFSGAFLLPLLVHSPDEEEFTPRPPNSIAKVLVKASKYKPSLLNSWFFGQFMFSGSMILAPFAASFRFATAIVAFCGMFVTTSSLCCHKLTFPRPWVLASWAPYAFLGVEVNRMSGPEAANGAANGTVYRRLSRSDRDNSIELQRIHRRGSSTLQLEHGSDEAVASTGELSGIYFGILNIYTTLPQFVGTFISMIVFAILEPGKSPELAQDAHPSEHHGTDGPNAIAVCLFIGALSTFGAAYAIWRLKHL